MMGRCDGEDEDIYDDLPSFKYDETLDDLKAEIEKLKQENHKLLSELKDSTQEKVKVESTCKILNANYSSLLKTAKLEIRRKDRTIEELRKQLNDFKNSRRVPVIHRDSDKSVIKKSNLKNEACPKTIDDKVSCPPKLELDISGHSSPQDAQPRPKRPANFGTWTSSQRSIEGNPRKLHVNEGPDTESRGLNANNGCTNHSKISSSVATMKQSSLPKVMEEVKLHAPPMPPPPTQYKNVFQERMYKKMYCNNVLTIENKQPSSSPLNSVPVQKVTSSGNETSAVRNVTSNVLPNSVDSLDIKNNLTDSVCDRAASSTDEIAVVSVTNSAKEADCPRLSQLSSPGDEVKLLHKCGGSKLPVEDPEEKENLRNMPRKESVVSKENPHRVGLGSPQKTAKSKNVFGVCSTKTTFTAKNIKSKVPPKGRIVPISRNWVVDMRAQRESKTEAPTAMSELTVNVDEDLKRHQLLETMFGSPLKWTEECSSDSTDAQKQMYNMFGSPSKNVDSSSSEPITMVLPATAFEDSCTANLALEKTNSLQVTNSRASLEEKPLKAEVVVDDFLSPSTQRPKKPSLFSPMKDYHSLGIVIPEEPSKSTSGLCFPYKPPLPYEDSVLGRFDDTAQFVAALAKVDTQISPLSTPVKSDCNMKPTTFSDAFQQQITEVNERKCDEITLLTSSRENSEKKKCCEQEEGGVTEVIPGISCLETPNGGSSPKCSTPELSKSLPTAFSSDKFTYPTNLSSFSSLNEIRASSKFPDAPVNVLEPRKTPRSPACLVPPKLTFPRKSAIPEAFIMEQEKRVMEFERKNLCSSPKSCSRTKTISTRRETPKVSPKRAKTPRSPAKSPRQVKCKSFESDLSLKALRMILIAANKMSNKSVSPSAEVPNDCTKTTVDSEIQSKTCNVNESTPDLTSKSSTDESVKLNTGDNSQCRFSKPIKLPVSRFKPSLQKSNFKRSSSFRRVQRLYTSCTFGAKSTTVSNTSVAVNKTCSVESSLEHPSGGTGKSNEPKSADKEKELSPCLPMMGMAHLGEMGGKPGNGCERVGGLVRQSEAEKPWKVIRLDIDCGNIYSEVPSYAVAEDPRKRVICDELPALDAKTNNESPPEKLESETNVQCVTSKSVQGTPISESVVLLGPDVQERLLRVCTPLVRTKGTPSIAESAEVRRNSQCNKGVESTGERPCNPKPSSSQLSTDLSRINSLENKRDELVGPTSLPSKIMAKTLHSSSRSLEQRATRAGTKHREPRIETKRRASRSPVCTRSSKKQRSGGTIEIEARCFVANRKYDERTVSRSAKAEGKTRRRSSTRPNEKVVISSELTVSKTATPSLGDHSRTVESTSLDKKYQAAHTLHISTKTTNEEARHLSSNLDRPNTRLSRDYPAVEESTARSSTTDKSRSSSSLSPATPTSPAGVNPSITVLSASNIASRSHCHVPPKVESDAKAAQSSSGSTAVVPVSPSSTEKSPLFVIRKDRRLNFSSSIQKPPLFTIKSGRPIRFGPSK